MYEEFKVTLTTGAESVLIFRFRDMNLPDGWYISYQGRELMMPLRRIMDMIDSIDAVDIVRLEAMPKKFGGSFSWHSWKPPSRNEDGTYSVPTPEQDESISSEYINELQQQVERLVRQ